MNFRVIIKMLGYFLFYFALTMLIPLLWSLYEGGPGYPYFALTILVTVTVGYLVKNFVPADEMDIALKDGFAIVTFAWILAAAVGAVPFLLMGVFDNFVDAFFETMSGFTTTGATVIEDIEALPRDILLWRSQTQWLGGMGIVVLFVALLPRLGIKGMQLLKAEVPGPVTEKVVPRVAKTAKILWLIYVSLTAAQIILMMLAGVEFYNAVSHAFTTMPTGGFSPFNDSIAGFDSALVEGIIVVFMMLAGVNFALYYNVVRGQPRNLLHNEEFRFYLGGLALFTIAVTVYLFMNGHGDTIFSSFRKGIFQVVSIATTTGYVTEDYELWPPFTRQLLFFLMFLGGCGGSTGGSIKQVRILAMIKHSFRELYKLIHPNAVIPVRINKKAVEEPVIFSILGYIILYVLIFLLSTLIISISMNISMDTSFSATAATLGNVGPGLGQVGPVETYAFFNAPIKLLLSFLMMLGRLEVYTVLVMLLPEFRSFGKKRRRLF